MRIFRGFEGVEVIRNPVVTTGSFDGVHLGHKTILNRLKILAEEIDGESVLITFHPHPRKVLYPESAGRDLKLINSQEEKLELLEKAGLNNLIIIEFTKEFSKTTSERFVEEFLHDKLHARIVVAGFNHHFGFNKEGDYRQLWSLQKKYNFIAEEIPEQLIRHETVSSTRIRQALNEGYIQRANAYLDHYYIIIGKAGKALHELPVALHPLYEIELTEECKLIPSSGIYAVSVDSDRLNSKGMAITMTGPENNATVLLYLLAKQELSESRKVALSFHKKIHGALNFSDTSLSFKINNAIEEISELIY
jgi:riboflavin kinase / FMN adenylyltransferase